VAGERQRGGKAAYSSTGDQHRAARWCGRRRQGHGAPLIESPVVVRALEPFRVKWSWATALSFCFLVLLTGKPVPTFPEALQNRHSLATRPRPAKPSNRAYHSRFLQAANRRRRVSSNTGREFGYRPPCP